MTQAKQRWDAVTRGVMVHSTEQIALEIRQFLAWLKGRKTEFQTIFSTGLSSIGNSGSLAGINRDQSIYVRFVLKKSLQVIKLTRIYLPDRSVWLMGSSRWLGRLEKRKKNSAPISVCVMVRSLLASSKLGVELVTTLR